MKSAPDLKQILLSICVTYCTNSPTQVTLKSGIALFITVNNETAPAEGIPVDIKLLFRTVALVMPDYSSILKARCAAYGFRSPRMLADRLKMVAQQCKEQL